MITIAYPRWKFPIFPGEERTALRIGAWCFWREREPDEFKKARDRFQVEAQALIPGCYQRFILQCLLATRRIVLAEHRQLLELLVRQGG